MARSGPINVPIVLSVKFYENGDLFNPFSVGPVRIYEVAVGGTALAVLTPDAYSTGLYRVTWDALSTSSSLQPGTYYDEWDWIAQDGMPTKTQRYSFELTTAVETEEEETVTESATQTVGCRPKPTWIHRYGLQLIEDIGNGTGLDLGWEEARTADSDRQIHYNIYYADTRYNVWDYPILITTARTVTVNIDPGNVYYFAVKATEFDTDIDITELTQVSANAYQYPDEQTLLNDLPESQDGYRIAVDSVAGYPSTGELLIDQEIIRYASLDTTTNEFVVAENNRAITLTFLDSHSAGATVKLWHGIEDGNTIIRAIAAGWHDINPRNTDAIGQVNVDADGYRAANTDNLTTDFTASDENTADFNAYDFCGYHRPSLQSLFSGLCENTYVGGNFNGFRGFNFQDRNLGQLDVMLQVTGEPVILLRRKWTGKRCKCIDLRREHHRTRCDRCYGTGFDGGYDRFFNTRPISELFTNTSGAILVRIHPYANDLELIEQGLMQPDEITCWTINVPNVRDRDLIIRFNEGGTEEFRYEVLNVTRNKLLFGQSGRQEIKMRKLDKTDTVMTYDYTDSSKFVTI